MAGHLSQLIKPPPAAVPVPSSYVPFGTHILRSATSVCDPDSYSSLPCGNISVLTFIIGFHFPEQRETGLAGTEGIHRSGITPRS